jgi:DNA-binding CsgD family transcriptional regulator
LEVGAKMVSVARRINAPTQGAPRFATLLVGTETERLASALPSLRGLGTTAVQATASARAGGIPRPISNVDICLIDAPTGNLTSEIRALRSHGWRRIAVLANRVEDVRTALDAGARSAFMPAVRRGTIGIVADEPSGAGAIGGVSGREMQVLQGVADGLSNKEIAARLSLSALTVKSHLARIGRKLGTGDRAELVAIGMRQRLID